MTNNCNRPTYNHLQQEIFMTHLLSVYGGFLVKKVSHIKINDTNRTEARSRRRWWALPQWWCLRMPPGGLGARRTLDRCDHPSTHRGSRDPRRHTVHHGMGQPSQDTRWLARRLLPTDCPATTDDRMDIYSSQGFVHQQNTSTYQVLSTKIT